MHQQKKDGKHTPDEKSTENNNDVLFYPKELISERSEPVFNKRGERQMFFPFRDMKEDPKFEKLLEVLKKDNLNMTGSLKETLYTKLNWNSKMVKKQHKAVNEISTKTFDKLMSSTREWKEKTKKVPTIIKRYYKFIRKHQAELLPYGEAEDESEDSLLKEAKLSSPQSNSHGLTKRTFTIRQATMRSQPIKADSLIVVNRTNKKKDNLFALVEMPPLDDRQAKQREYRMAWYPRSKGNATVGFMVDSKEGRSCIFYKDILYLYGGYSPSTDQIFFQGFNMTTKKMFDIRSKISREPLPRAFQSMCIYEDYLIIFGGEIFSIYTDSRLMTNELVLFSLKSQEYIKVNIHDNIDPRKHHTACIIGSHLVIYGGIDEESRTLNSFLSLNLVKHTETTGLYSRPKDGAAPRLVWKKILMDPEPRAISNHTMTPVYLTNPRHLITGQQKSKFSNVIEAKKVLLEGLYIFGGVDSNGKYSNVFQIVNTGRLWVISN